MTALAFNLIADGTTRELSQYPRTIAFLKDLQDNWGPDQSGKIFTFDIFQSTFFGGAILILGRYATPQDLSQNGQVKALLIGVPPSAEKKFPDLKGHVFTVHGGWYENQGTLDEKAFNLISNGGVTHTCTDDTVDHAIKYFLQARMREHPRYQAALHSSATKIIKATEARSPV